MQEDPERHVTELIDCLMQSSRPTAFLFGAGCPCALKNAAGESLIPDIAGLTNDIDQNLKTGSHAIAWSVLRQTCVDDGDPNPNVEQILDRIRGLNSFAGQGQVRGLGRAELEGLEKAICNRIVSVAKVELPEGDSPYHSLAVWIKSTKRTEAIEIFTTNYDLLTEQSLERNQTPFFDGFVGSRRPFFDVESVTDGRLPERWTRLWKIHGSVNWQRDKTQKCIYRSEVGDSAIIHPSNLKYDESRKLPYLALMDRLRRFLRHGQPILICVGYSFRDQHINEAIIDALGGNPSAMVFGLMHGAMDKYAEGSALAKRSASLRLYASDACIIGARQFEWLEAKAKPEDKFPPGVIDWQEVASGGPKWKPVIHLGDFARVGDLFAYVSQGRRPVDAHAASGP